MTIKIVFFVVFIFFYFESISQKNNSNYDSVVSLFESKLKGVGYINSKDSSLSGIALIKLSNNKKKKAIILNEIPENYRRFINKIIFEDSTHLLAGFKKNTILPVIFLNLYGGISEEEVGLIQSRTIISAISMLSNDRKFIILKPAIILRREILNKRTN